VIVDALVVVVLAGGGEICCGILVIVLVDLLLVRVVLFDFSLCGLIELVCGLLLLLYEGWLRWFCYGGGVCKVDFVLLGLVFWVDDDCW